ncbi:hypothetical protein XELAEV_18004610mg [Xenopus laevis]|uniref:Uncharacterized protein n=1 Tax=Xenopus laevis TaxID=8355 RepID=A0A974GZJ5_XENLA|nr:hypothetical protein XELAEV_18004610mg [Xenopus laevis]
MVSPFSDVSIEGNGLVDDDEAGVLVSCMDVAVGEESVDEETEVDSLSMAELAVGQDTVLELVSLVSEVIIEGKELVEDDESRLLVSGVDFTDDSVSEEKEVNSLSANKLVALSDTVLELVLPFSDVTIEGNVLLDNTEVGVLACGIDVAVDEESVDEETEVDSLSLVELGVSPDTILELVSPVSEVTIEGKELVDDDEPGVLVSGVDVSEDSVCNELVDDDEEGMLVSCMDVTVGEEFIDEETEVDSLSMAELSVGPDTVLELISPASEVVIEGKKLVDKDDPGVLDSGVDVSKDSVYEDTEVNSLSATELVVSSDTELELISIFSDVIIEGKELVDDDVARVRVSGMDVAVGE